MKKYIFVLICPDTKKVKYVGYSKNPIRRYHQHVYNGDGGNKSAVGDWIRSFKKVKPEIRVVEYVAPKKLRERVLYWENHYKKNGLLALNRQNKTKMLRIFISTADFESIKKAAGGDEGRKIQDYIREKLLKEEA